jgi:hypothetical protein
MAACITPKTSTLTASPPTQKEDHAPSAGPLGDYRDLRASLHAPPARLVYDPQSLGVSGQFVSISVENVSPRVVPVAHMHAAFAASRDGVAFACNAHVRGALGAVEPSHVAPGQSVTFQRLLDCTMPLPGGYDVRVWIHATDRETGEDRAAPGIGMFVGSFHVDVTAVGNAPRPVPEHPGLYALMTGASTAPPMSADDWTKGGYRVAVAIVNGSSRPVTLLSSGLSLLLFKEGERLPCTGQKQALDEPTAIAPGAVHISHVPLTCAPQGEGRYQIVGRLVAGDAAEVEIGRVGLVVTRSPYFLFTPETLTAPPR